MRTCKAIFIIACLSSGLLINGCASLSYYAQSIAGQSELLSRQEATDELLEQGSLDANTKQRLHLVQELRRFSIEELGLPDNDSYTSYADLERDYVVWNIFATEEFSLTPKQWCFPIAGCLPYRGYFMEQSAHEEKQLLETQGYDVFLGGVAAYSTLGWFDDPVLNTMFKWSDTYLAKVMFHELAHQQLYVKNDTEFNESYADAVAIIGVRRWLEGKQKKEALQQFEADEAREQQFIDLVMEYKKRLEALFSSSRTETSMRDEKARLYLAMQNDYEELKKSWQDGSYDNWFNGDLNNARLASVVTYRTYVEDMFGIYEKSGRNLSIFYDIILAISNCDREMRRRLLKNQSATAGC